MRSFYGYIKMVASTDIKFFVHTNNNAPQLQNAYGSMINVLDACLVNGINIGTMSSLTASGTTVTALFSSAHNLMQYQVIKIAGASQPEFNGEHRILTVPNAQSVTFELAAAPSTATATGTITASLPPLGWEKPFSSTNVSGGGKAAYRSKNLLLPSRPFLRVVDELDPVWTASYAKYAKVGIVENMTDIDTMFNQAPYDSTNPNKNWIGSGTGTSAINGWARWYYARSTDIDTQSGDHSTPGNGNRPWLIVGDGDNFYIIPSVIIETDKAFIYGFGKINKLIESDEFNYFLSATIYNGVASATAYRTSSTPLSSTSSSNLCILRNQKQEISPVFAKTVSAGIATTINSGSSDYIALTTPLLNANTIAVDTNNALRGSIPHLRWLFNSTPFQDKEISIDKNEVFIAKNTSYGNSSKLQILIKIGELYD